MFCSPVLCHEAATLEERMGVGNVKMAGKKSCGVAVTCLLAPAWTVRPFGVARRPEPPGIKPGQGYFVAGGNPLACFVIWALAVYRQTSLLLVSTTHDQ